MNNNITCLFGFIKGYKHTYNTYNGKYFPTRSQILNYHLQEIGINIANTHGTFLAEVPQSLALKLLDQATNPNEFLPENSFIVVIEKIDPASRRSTPIDVSEVVRISQLHHLRQNSKEHQQTINNLKKKLQITKNKLAKARRKPVPVSDNNAVKALKEKINNDTTNKTKFLHALQDNLKLLHTNIYRIQDQYLNLCKNYKAMQANLMAKLNMIQKNYKLLKQQYSLKRVLAKQSQNIKNDLAEHQKGNAQYFNQIENNNLTGKINQTLKRLKK